MTTDTANAYLRTKVLTASPEELRLMLLDGAIRFARQGQRGIQEQDYEATYEGLTNCRNIVVELMTSIRDDIAPDLCERVRTLYSFLFTELTESSLSKDATRIGRVIELLEYERETWSLLMDKLAAERTANVQSLDSFTDDDTPPSISMQA